MPDNIIHGTILHLSYALLDDLWFSQYISNYQCITDAVNMCQLPQYLYTESILVWSGKVKR